MFQLCEKACQKSLNQKTKAVLNKSQSNTRSHIRQQHTEHTEKRDNSNKFNLSPHNLLVFVRRINSRARPTVKFIGQLANTWRGCLRENWKGNKKKRSQETTIVVLSTKREKEKKFRFSRIFTLPMRELFCLTNSCCEGCYFLCQDIFVFFFVFC